MGENHEELNSCYNKDKKITIVLIIVVLVLSIGVGVGGGLLLNKTLNSNSNMTQNVTNNTSKNQANNKAANNAAKNETQNTTNNATKENSEDDISKSNTVPKSSEYEKAIAEITKCLKDENWLKQNELLDRENQYDEYSTKKIYFGRLNPVGNKPYYVLSVKVLDANYIYVVSYDGSEVTLSNKCGADYGNVKLDFNNNVAEVEATTFLAYYKFTNGRFELLDRVDRNESSAVKENQLKERYKNYKFYSIDTKLTSTNIDEYVK